MGCNGVQWSRTELEKKGGEKYHLHGEKAGGNLDEREGED